MIANGNIKNIMYMGEEISDARYNDKIVWVKKALIKPPPKPCTTCQTRCEKTTQCGTCQNLSQCTCQSAQSCGESCDNNCLALCQNNNELSES